MNLLLSYPRSGNTWLRYCVEFLTKKPTIGYETTDSAKFDRQPIGCFVDIGIDKDAENILVKRHETNRLPNKIDKLILIVRNYKESIPRHKEGKTTLSTLKNSCSSNKSSENYTQMLEYYEYFSGDKIIIYYEDLITKLKPTLKKIINFLGEEDKYLESFFNEIEIHKNKSIRIYGVSQTKGEHINHHSKKMSKQQRKNWDEFIKNNHKNLFDKYLKRYEEDE